MRIRLLTICLLLPFTLAAAACSDGAGDTPDRSPASGASTSTGSAEGSPGFTLDELGQFDQPVFVTQPPGSKQLAIVEQGGRVVLLDASSGKRATLLDLRGKVSSGSEQGLLGLAFHPKYADNQRLFINYTDVGGDTRVEEWGASGGNATRTREVLRVDQPYENHNGGHLAFGPDGLLYIGLGDGGSAGDPEQRAQNPGDLLGKMLRIDVDAEAPYASPKSNPFVGKHGRDEIWATGLRNPWRYSFDRETGDLWIGDVGQGAWEEVDREPADAEGGANYGWDAREGYESYEDPGPLRGARPSDPVIAYSHDDGCSITGGYVYRGEAIPSLRGWYLYADFCSDWIRAARSDEPGEKSRQLKGVAQISSFGEDSSGELYVTALSGTVYRIVPAR